MVGRTSGVLPGLGTTDRDVGLLSVGAGLLDCDGPCAAIGRTADDGVISTGIADVRGNVKPVPAWRTAVFAPVGRLFVIVIGGDCLGPGSKGDGFGSKELGIIAVLGHVAVLSGSNLGTGRRKARLR
jgi:hypothetical protein